MFSSYVRKLFIQQIYFKEDYIIFILSTNLTANCKSIRFYDIILLLFICCLLNNIKVHVHICDLIIDCLPEAIFK